MKDRSRHGETPGGRGRESLPEEGEGDSAGRDPLVDHFFPDKRDRRRAALRTVVEVGVGAVVLAVGVVVLFRCYRVLDSVYASWRLGAMMERTFTAEQVREDVEFVIAALEERHPQPFAHRSRDETAAEAARLEEALTTGTTRAELLRATSRLVAGVGCGHTQMMPPFGFLKLVARGGRMLPLGVRFIGERAFVVEHFGPDRTIERGSEVVEVNGQPVAEILDNLLAAISSDGPGRAYARWKVDQRFFYEYAMLVGMPERFVIRYCPHDGGATTEHALHARPAIEVAQTYWAAHPDDNPRQVPFPFHGAVDDEASVAYLRVPTFGIERARGYEQALVVFFSRLARDGIRTLVLDVRGNPGGPSILAVELLRYLLPRRFALLEMSDDPEDAKLPVFQHYATGIEPHRGHRFDGPLYVLIDGGSFSTTGHLCAALACHRDVVFVGEPSGGSFACHDNGVPLELPRSGLRLRVATTTFRVRCEGIGGLEGIEPDVPITPSLEDLIGGHDAVLRYLDQTLGSHLTCAEVRSLAPTDS